MINLILIEQISDAHGSLIVDAFNKFFILNGGEKDGIGYAIGYGYGYGDGGGGGYGGVYGGGSGGGYGDGGGDGYGSSADGIPKEWQVK